MEQICNAGFDHVPDVGKMIDSGIVKVTDYMCAITGVGFPLIYVTFSLLRSN